MTSVVIALFTAEETRSRYFICVNSTTHQQKRANQERKLVEETARVVLTKNGRWSWISVGFIKLLCRNRIDTSEQFFSYKTGLNERMKTLTVESEVLRKLLRQVTDEPDKAEIKAKIAILTKSLGEVRRAVSLYKKGVDIYVRQA